MRKALVLLAVAVMFINSTAYAEVRKEYYESGQLRKEVNYKDDKREGLSKYYYESGQLKDDSYFMNGEMISEKRYDPNGNLESEQEYPTK